MEASVMCLLFLFAIQETFGVNIPRFTSNWTRMDSNNSSTTYLKFDHNFGVVPIHVEVQVKTDQNYIFPGVHSAYHGNDDRSRGGVISRFNAHSVELFGATNDVGVNSGTTPVNGSAYIAYTGHESYVQDNVISETAAMVRVRVWHEDDFPDPDYESSPFDIERSGGKSHADHRHPLKMVPEFAVVRLAHESGWYSEAQGTETNQLVDGAIWGGVMFGINALMVRLWAPSEKSDEKGIFSVCDGWGNVSEEYKICNEHKCKVTVMLWMSLDALQLMNNVTMHSMNTSSHLNVSTELPFNIDYDLFIVWTEALDGNNAYFRFPASGAAQNDGYGADGTSGLVYAYNAATMTMHGWHPIAEDSLARCLVHMNESKLGVGDQKQPQCSTTANIHMVVWRGGLQCPYVMDEPNEFTRMTANTTTYVHYECTTDSLVKSGNLTMDCDPTTGTWDGTPAECGSPCQDIVVPPNTVLVSYNATVTQFGCTKTTRKVEGDFIHVCINKTWTGVTPTCVLCPTIDSGINTVLEVLPFVDSLVANYSCLKGTDYASGDFVRYCVLGTGNTSVHWTGEKPNCQAVSTPEAIVEAIEVAEEISRNLTIEVKTTSKFIRSLTSARDNRQSATFIGLFGSLILALVFGFMLLLDLMGICMPRKSQKKE